MKVKSFMKYLIRSFIQAFYLNYIKSKEAGKLKKSFTIKGIFCLNSENFIQETSKKKGFFVFNKYNPGASTWVFIPDYCSSNETVD